MTMQTYTVKSGDSLGKIAKRFLGAAGKWSILAEANGIRDPKLLRVGQELVIPSTEALPAPTVMNPPVPPLRGDTDTFRFTEEGKKVYATSTSTLEKTYLGKLFKKGLFRLGTHQPEDHLATQTNLGRELKLSKSEIDVMLSTSENEGNLDAINTWDNQYLSFGMFQWTAGGKDVAGELPALLELIREQYPDVFENYWGRFGLDIIESNGTAGYFTLNGRKLSSDRQKQKLRDYSWVLRFIRAGGDTKVQGAQVLHAIRRLDRFYFQSRPKLDGKSLASLISSEYGVALLLDNHVNRPGYVMGCVAKAIDQANTTTEKLANGSAKLERRILRQYLTIRETYGKRPMTDAAARAAVTKRYVQNGQISDEKNSFRTNRDARQ